MRPNSKKERVVDGTVLLVCALGFLGAVIALGYFGHADVPTMFMAFALLPGMIGVANYIVSQRPLVPEQKRSLHHLMTACGEEPEDRELQPHFVHSVAASLGLTAVFLVVAFAEPSKSPGLVYAGYGAYISTLWFMLVRLNANALSPRFLVNSALKASIAMLVGFVASKVSGFGMGNHEAPQAVFFLMGLFYPLAMKRLRTTAMTTFGITTADTAELPVRLLEGVDDGAADMLEEMGITSVQHLATTRASEVCARTFYSPDRVLDWIDQSILAVHTNGGILKLRSVGIRSARSLVILEGLAEHGPHQAAAAERFKHAAQLIGLSEGGLCLVKECISRDPAFRVLVKRYPIDEPHEQTVHDSPFGKDVVPISKVHETASASPAG